MTYGYIRVSTDRQTVENQRFEIQEFAKRNSISVETWIEETASGTITPEHRELGKLLEKIQKGDLIICSELSRLGRSLFMIMSILNKLMEKGARVWTIKDGYRLGDDIQSKVLAFAFGLSAEIERNLISQRTKEALERKKAEGQTRHNNNASSRHLHKPDCKSLRRPPKNRPKIHFKKTLGFIRKYNKNTSAPWLNFFRAAFFLASLRSAPKKSGFPHFAD